MSSRAPQARRAALVLLLASAACISYAAYIPAKAVVAQVLLERAWARTQEGETDIKPWPWADISPIAELSVPRLHEREIVLEDTSGEAMAFGPGHMPNTPMIGAKGTAIVAAHRDTQFRFLRELEQGDIITAAMADGRRSMYRVTSFGVVRADSSGLDPAEGGPAGSRLALVTCYPFDGVLHGPLRYVVLADRIAETATKD